MNNRFRILILSVVIGWLLLGMVTVFSLESHTPETTVYTDYPSFVADTGPLTNINFENLPPDGSNNPGPGQEYIPNPLVQEGVSFTDPYALTSGFCADPTCPPDPENPDGGNIVLMLNQEGTIQLPLGTGGIMLVVDGMGVVSYTVEVIDFAGSVITVTSQTEEFATDYLGFTADEGIQQVTITAVGPTPDCPQSPCGPLVMSQVFVELDDPTVTFGVWQDPAHDVSLPHADLTYGTAVVWNDKVDIRLRFLDIPFMDDLPQTVSWCLNTDGDAGTGNVCDQPGADETFSLIGNFGALYGNGFTFAGALSGLDPCSIGWYDWHSHTLRLVFPLSLISPNENFHYAVDSIFDDDSVLMHDWAPDVVDFSSSDGAYSSYLSATPPPPFSGMPLCSVNGVATITVPAEASGTVRHLPELGVLEVAPVGDLIISSYFKTTAMNREFRRGFLEMPLPELPQPLAQANLILFEERAQISPPVPPITHELSFYQPADLDVTVDDFDRSSAFLTTLTTDANLPTEVFTVDLTDVVSNSITNTLGFRLKLEVDPVFTAFDNFGSGFGSLSTQAPQLVIQLADAQTPLQPGQEGELTHTDGNGRTLTLTAPIGTVTETTNLLYTRLSEESQVERWATAVAPSDLLPIEIAFHMALYQGMMRQPDTVLQQPLTLTLTYNDEDVVGLNEGSLVLQRWNGSQWEYAACGPYERNLAENWLIVPVCQSGDWQLFGSSLFGVQVIAAPGGEIHVQPEQPGYTFGETITVTAVPNPGWSFTQWGGGLSGNENPQVITITQNLSITAEFTVVPYTLDVQTIGNGSVIIQPQQPVYQYGDVITVTAVPDIGWQFSHWNGDLSGDNNPQVFTVTQNTAVTAVFVEIPYRLYLPVVIRP